MCNTEEVTASELTIGDLIIYDGKQMRVSSQYLHPKSCYAKIHLTPADKPNAIPLYIKLGLKSIIERETKVSLEHLNISNAVEHLAVLKDLLQSLDDANDLPERVKIEGISFEVDSVLIRRKAHEDLMAEFNRFKNNMALIKKP